MHQTGDGRFRPNKIDYHRGAGITAAAGTVLTHLLSKSFEEKRKDRIYPALESPITVSVLSSFATAASRRTWILVSESISGLLPYNPYASKARGYFTPLLPDTPQAHPVPPGLSSTHRSRRSGLWGIVLSFPRLSPSTGQVTHVTEQYAELRKLSTCMS